jgi:hypothetical protein
MPNLIPKVPTKQSRYAKDKERRLQKLLMRLQKSAQQRSALLSRGAALAAELKTKKQ